MSTRSCKKYFQAHSKIINKTQSVLENQRKKMNNKKAKRKDAS